MYCVILTLSNLYCGKIRKTVRISENEFANGGINGHTNFTGTKKKAAFQLMEFS